MVVNPQVFEGEVDDSDDTFYFKYVGGVQFRPTPKPLEAPGNSRLVAVSNTYGITVFSDLSGVYVARTIDLVHAASKDVAKDGYPAPAPGSLCLVTLSSPQGVSHVALSVDELVLACAAQNTLYFYSLPELVKGGSPQPLAQIPLNGGVTQLRWCKDPQHASHYLAVTDEHFLVVGSCPAAPQLLAAEVLDADWAPEAGTCLVYSSGNRLFVVDGGKRCATPPMAEVDVTHPDVPADQLYLDSVHWPEPRSLMLGGSQVQGKEEANDMFVMQLSLKDWSPILGGEPSDALLVTYTPRDVEAECTPLLQGPYLHCTTFLTWGALLLAHRKANDEHMQLFQWAEEGRDDYLQVTVEHDALRIMLPNGPGGPNGPEDNYVLGLAMDWTTDLGPLPHPLSAEQPDLPPSPLLTIMTSDAALRFYRFGNMKEAGSVLQAALPLPATTPTWAAAARATGTSSPGVGVAAGGVGLAGPAASSMGMHTVMPPPVPVLPPAAASAAHAKLPDSDEEQLEEVAPTRGSGTGSSAAATAAGAAAQQPTSGAAARAAEAAMRRAQRRQHWARSCLFMGRFCAGPAGV